MSDAPTTDPTNLPVDNPDAPPTRWVDPEIPEFAQDYSDHEAQLAKLMNPSHARDNSAFTPPEPEPDPSDPGPDESQAEPASPDGQPDPGLESGTETSPETPAPTPVPDHTDAPDAPPLATEPTVDDGPWVPPSARAPEATSSAPAQTIQLGDRSYPLDQAEALLQLIDLGTQQVLQTPVIPGQAPPVAVPPGSPTLQTPPPVEFDPNSYDDPDLARALHAQSEQFRELLTPIQRSLEDMQAERQMAEQERQRQVYVQIQQDERDAVADVQTEFALSNAEMEELYKITESSGIVNGMAAANQTRPFRELAVDALKTMYYATDKFRTRDIESQVHARVLDEVQNQQITGKKSRAGSLAGGGGAISRAAAPKRGANGQPRDPMAEALERAGSETV